MTHDVCRRLLVFILVGTVFMLAARPLTADTFSNPIIASGADPWAVYKDGFYYYAQTTGTSVKIRRAARITGSGGLGSATAVTVFTPAAPNNQNVWAPELHFLNGKWYIYFAADDGTNANHRMYVAESVSSDPQGAYTSKGKIYDTTTDRWAIDGTVLQKNDGSLYFIWSGWPGAVDGKQNLYIAPMSNPWTISGPRVRIATPTYSWEGWIEEGPEIIQRNGKIFIIYSANASWMDDYCLGRLTNTNGDVLNPAAWVKTASPVFSRYTGADGSVYGPGHASFTKSVDQTEDWIVYHAAKYSGAGWDRNVRAQKFTWNADDSPNFGSPIPTNVPVTVPSGEGTAPVLFTLTLITNGTGTIARNPNQVGYVANSTVMLTATANPGNRFTGWSGAASGTNNPLLVTMNNNKTITGNFSDEIIIDDPDANFAGDWSPGTLSGDKYGSTYRFAFSVTSAPTATATFVPDIPTTGHYDVQVWYPQGGNRVTDAAHQITSDDGTITVLVNQTTNGGGWRTLVMGKRFAQGTNGFVRLLNHGAVADKVTMADAVRFVFSTNQSHPPSIVTTPQARVARVGSNVTFTVTVAGSLPLNYHWRFNDKPIDGATSSSYTRTNVQVEQAGNYSVTATNQFGNVTSETALLTVLSFPPAQFESIALLPGQGVRLVLSGGPGNSYALEMSSNLVTWIPLTNLIAPAGTFEFEDRSGLDAPQRFYRAVLAP